MQYTVIYKAFLHSFSYNSYNPVGIDKIIFLLEGQKLRLWELGVWDYKYQRPGSKSHLRHLLVSYMILDSLLKF